MAETRKPSRPRKGAASKTAGQEVQRHRGKSLEGELEAGTELHPGDLVRSLVAGRKPEEHNRPRPARTRFPIDFEEYMELKREAASTKAPALKTRDANLVQDTGRGKSRTTGLAPAQVPATVANFAGIADTGLPPADCALAAGPQHVLVAVNSSVAVYAKTGGAPLLQHTLTAWFSNVVGQAKIFDPRALYDQHADRWVLLAVALSVNTNESWFLLSVSRSSDPLGGWWNYRLDATLDGASRTANWADYPGLGVDPQALYITANMFRFNGGFQYAKIRAVPKAGVYSGGAAAFRDFIRLVNEDGSPSYTVQPCHTFGAPQVQYFVSSYFPNPSRPFADRLSLWALTNPLTAPALVRRTVPTGSYALPPDAPQKGSPVPLDTGDVRILNAVFRGGSVWTVLTSRYNWGDGANVAVPHWFQINPTSGQLVQQGIFGAPKLHYYYPAIQPDGNGNVALVFSRSSSSEYASTFYAARQATDPVGQLQPSVPLKLGTAPYVHVDGNNRNRWGDYAGIGSDPVDNRTVWIYSPFVAAANKWGTWIGAVKL